MSERRRLPGGVEIERYEGDYVYHHLRVGGGPLFGALPTVFGESIWLAAEQLEALRAVAKACRWDREGREIPCRICGEWGDDDGDGHSLDCPVRCACSIGALEDDDAR